MTVRFHGCHHRCFNADWVLLSACLGADACSGPRIAASGLGSAFFYAHAAQSVPDHHGTGPLLFGTGVGASATGRGTTP